VVIKKKKVPLTTNKNLPKQKKLAIPGQKQTKNRKRGSFKQKKSPWLGEKGRCLQGFGGHTMKKGGNGKMDGGPGNAEVKPKKTKHQSLELVEKQ